ncbi:MULTISPECIES: protein-L-isoaspartate(D-aspartate) O-methyltransferase [Halorussus]|uniref:protein-L-isoaspartate(D-aspartate) O-methyltransferase n=1 Tax=Halorussus TaxID=1070314 RepID=UPI000E217CCA|nr:MULTISPECIES: protein-L-isoaspartate(D-aspartate) O-methyltransferase [Halorussus]NHN61184.1 protein-L-isoaspartate(D-aspartate) O-methyltransferase [Halorussus sp. JP-T4]
MFGGGDDSDRNATGHNQDADYRRARERMVDALTDRDDFAASTLDAMRAVPRHEFVPPGRRDSAYADRPLPIGNDQTISAPHMVASMVDMLDLDAGESVLEIGTGCGYHAAVTAEAVGPSNVHSVEFHESLAREARDRLDRLGYGDVSVRVGDGREGWDDHAPYDAAYLTAAPSDFPSAVVEQVRPEGRLLAPLGSTRGPAAGQRLVFARRRADGSLDREPRGRVRFVPMQGD